jgi:ribosomal protein S28E/S33
MRVDVLKNRQRALTAERAGPVRCRSHGDILAFHDYARRTRIIREIR